MIPITLLSTLAVIWLLGKLGIIKISTSERLRAWAANCLLENLPPFLLTLAATAGVALIFAIILLIRGSLPRITPADIEFIWPGRLALHYNLTRWWDLSCIAIWGFVNLNIPRVFYKFADGGYQKSKWRAIWRKIKVYWRWYLTLAAGGVALGIFHGFVYALAANVAAWIALGLIHPRTIRFYIWLICKIIEIIGTLFLMLFYGDINYKEHENKKLPH